MAETQEGFSYIVSRPLILGVTVMEAVSSVFGLDNTMLTIFASDVLRVGAHGFGLLQSARGLGAVVGSSCSSPSDKNRIKARFSSSRRSSTALGFALFGLSPYFPLALALMTLVGLTDTVWGAARGTIMQMITPDKFRGRVMGVFQLSNRGLHPLGQVESGLLIPLIGVRETTVFGGLLVTVVTLVTAWKVPAIPKFRWDDERHKAPAD